MLYDTIVDFNVGVTFSQGKKFRTTPLRAAHLCYVHTRPVKLVLKTANQSADGYVMFSVCSYVDRHKEIWGEDLCQILCAVRVVNYDDKMTFEVKCPYNAKICLYKDEAYNFQHT